MIGKIIQLHQFFWMWESQHQQRLSWEDAAEARMARMRAEAQAAAQLHAMLIANPSGQLGRSSLNDRRSLEDGGFL